jgi:hypothetical protein
MKRNPKSPIPRRKGIPTPSPTPRPIFSVCLLSSLLLSDGAEVVDELVAAEGVDDVDEAEEDAAAVGVVLPDVVEARLGSSASTMNKALLSMKPSAPSFVL